LLRQNDFKLFTNFFLSEDRCLLPPSPHIVTTVSYYQDKVPTKEQFDRLLAMFLTKAGAGQGEKVLQTYIR
ncbi:MAG: hypothetical protein D3919_04390, partial [Candidatus Electrothrix sp. AW5]|nr:hypothetical protein [Candidatus Electrothrix gigas]